MAGVDCSYLLTPGPHSSDDQIRWVDRQGLARRLTEAMNMILYLVCTKNGRAVSAEERNMIYQLGYSRCHDGSFST